MKHALVSLFVPLAQAKSKNKGEDKKQQQGRAVGIYLVGHLPPPETTVSRIIAASDPSRQLLQITDAVHGTLTVVDVAQPAQPKFIERSRLPAELAHAYVQIRMGDAALLSASQDDSPAHGGQLFRTDSRGQLDGRVSHQQQIVGSESRKSLFPRP